jgi:hypothetical protein
LTVFGVLGGTAAREEYHLRTLELLDVPPAGGPGSELGDLYLDALPCLEELAQRGFRLGLAGNQPASVERFRHSLGVEVELIASSASFNSKRSATTSHSNRWPLDQPRFSHQERTWWRLSVHPIALGGASSTPL